LDASLIENLELSGTAWDGLMHIIYTGGDEQ